MTGRERILKVLARETADCIPFDIGGTDCSMMHAIPHRDVRRELGLGDDAFRCACLIQILGEPDGPLMNALEVDAEPLSFGARAYKSWQSPFGIEMTVPKSFGVENLPDGSAVARNASGAVTHRMSAGGYYFDPVGTPLAHVTDAAQLSEFDDLFERWDYPAMYDESTDELAARARKQYAATDRAVVALWRLHYLQTGQLMRGYETFLCDLMIEKELAHALLGKLHRVYLARVETFMDAFADAFDVVFLTDDLGTQVSGLVPPAVYKEMLCPYISEVVAAIRKRGKRIVMHSCGSVFEFIPDLIAMGIDALNPVQVSARNMNPRDLVREFGKDIAFWGGGVNTQGAMNSPDPEVVRADVRQRLDEYGPDAHLVFTQVHNIQYDVPAANVLAMKDEFFKRARS